jgi:hypothetical protein
MGTINNINILITYSFSSRILKNRVIYKAPVQSELNHPLRIAESGRKEHISEPKQAIRNEIFLFLQNFILLFLIYYFRK